MKMEKSNSNTGIYISIFSFFNYINYKNLLINNSFSSKYTLQKQMTPEKKREPKIHLISQFFKK